MSCFFARRNGRRMLWRSMGLFADAVHQGSPLGSREVAIRQEEARTAVWRPGLKVHDHHGVVSAEPSPVPTLPIAHKERTHVILKGDNLYRIGIKYNVSWKVLMECNALSDPNSLRVGQKLRIPPPPKDDLRSELQIDPTLHR